MFCKCVMPLCLLRINMAMSSIWCQGKVRVKCLRFAKVRKALQEVRPKPWLTTSRAAVHLGRMSREDKMLPREDGADTY